MADLATPSAPVSTPSPTPASAPTGAPTSAPASAGNSPAADASLEATIDSLLATPSGQDTPHDGVVAPDAEQDAASAAAPATAPEVPGDAPAEDQPQVDLDDDPETDEDIDTALTDESKPTNLLDLKQPRGKRIYGAYKAYKAMTDAVGRELSVDEVVDHLQSHTDKVLMEHEFSSGDPAAQLNFINYWNQSDPQAMTGVAAQLPEYLAQTNVPAYNQMALPVVQRYIKHMYTRAMAEGDPNKQKAMLYMARMADWDLNDRYTPDDQLPKPADQLSQRESYVNQQLSFIQQQQQQAIANNQYQWNQSLDQANGSALLSEAQQALEPLKSVLTPRAYKSAESDFQTAVREHLAKDVEGARVYEVQRARGAKSLSSEDRDALASQFAQRAVRAVRAITPKFLKEYGAVAKAQSVQRNNALTQSAAAGKAPNGTGAPVQQSILPTQRQYASKGDQMDAMLDSVLGVKK